MVAAVPSSKQLSATLAALLDIRNTEAALAADEVAVRVGGVVLEAWGQLLNVITAGGSPSAAKSKAVGILATLALRLQTAVGDGLQELARGGYASAFQCWEDVLPKAYWKLAFPDDPELVLLEASDLDDDLIAFDLDPVSEWEKPREFKVPKRPKVKKVEKPKPKTIAKAKEAPSTAEIRSIINQGGYKRRLGKWSKKITDKDQVAERIAAGIASKKSPERIAKEIEPFVRGLSSSAKRIVRTEAARVANLMAEKTYEQFDSIIVGFQILGILDDRIRPHHAARHGTIWWKTKKPFAGDRPQLPDEPNCRCHYAPVLRDPSDVEVVEGPKVDTGTYSAWFQKQPEAVKRKVVGSRRWDAVKDKGGRPAWADFLDPKTGRLADVDDLEDATRSQLDRKRNRLNRVFRNRKTVAKKVR